MTTSLEVESKFELDEDGFERLKTIARMAALEEQLNVYYDSEWLLAENATTFRIRFKRGKPPVLTLKIPVSVTANQRVMREFELSFAGHVLRRHLPSSTGQRIDVASQLPPEIRDQLAPLGVALLQRVGWMRNARIVLDISGIGCLELDRTILPDGSVVYEVEVETDNKQRHHALCDFVRRTVPSARPSGMSKFQRFRHAVLCMNSQSRQEREESPAAERDWRPARPGR